MTDPHSTSADGRANDPLLGAKIGGRYVILRVIGTGGMGIVYQALQEELGRPVAIKVLGAAWVSDELAIQRFLREARTASNIGHPNIVTVHDMGRLEDGRPFLVMELLRGTSLADLLEAHARLPPERVASIVAELASALDAVHAKRIIHRDIKPENVLLVDADPDPPKPKLLDFGLAAFAIPSAESARLTRHGQVHGTPHYMAPETGGLDPIDHRADVYSLAVVTYELLTGKVPFDSPNPLHILTQKMQLDPPSLRETGLAFPEGLEAVVRKGLARMPDERYPSAGEFAADFGRAVLKMSQPNLPVSSLPSAREPLVSGPLPIRSWRSREANEPPRPSDIPSERRRWPIPVAALAVLALAGGGWLFAARPNTSNDPKATRAQVTPASTTTEFSEAPPEVAEPSPDHEAGATANLGEVDANIPADSLAEPTKSAPRERARRSLEANAAEIPDSEPPSLPRVEAPEPSGLAPEDRARAEERTREGTGALVAGRIPEAIDHFRSATLAHPRYAPAWRGLGLANERLGRIPEAKSAYRRYLELSPKAADAESVQARLSALDASP